MGGLNILNSTETGEFNYSLSRKSTKVLTDSLKDMIEFDSNLHLVNLLSVRDEMLKEKDRLIAERFNTVFRQLDTQQQRAVTRTKDMKISLWLNVHLF